MAEGPAPIIMTFIFFFSRAQNRGMVSRRVGGWRLAVGLLLLVGKGMDLDLGLQSRQ